MPEQASTVPETLPKPIQKRRRRITEQDAQVMAQLIATKSLTDTEACQYIGKTPQAWFTWKSRNKNTARFSDVLTRVRGSVIVKMIDSIEDAGFGRNGYRADWRALLARLQLIDSNRFSTQPRQDTSPAQVIEAMGEFVKTLARVYQPKQIEATTCSEPKQIGHDPVNPGSQVPDTKQ